MSNITRNPKGSGMVRRRSDGRWEGRYTVGFDPGTGKQIQNDIAAFLYLETMSWTNNTQFMYGYDAVWEFYCGVALTGHGESVQKQAMASDEMGKITICLALALLFIVSSAACGTQAELTDETVTTEVTETVSAETTSENTSEAASETDDEIITAEKEIASTVERNEYNFITEAEFYRALSELLALHDLEMTPYPGDNAYYYFNYGNVTSVKLLTVSKTMDEIEADRAAAQEAYEKQVAEFNAEQAAIANGEAYTPETESETEPESETTVFDPSKDVTSSGDYVTSFVLSATDSEVDQQLMFLVSAAVWSILNPAYDNTDDSFQFLWRALYSTYNSSGGLAVSTIDGIDNSYSFSIPGNAVEAWMGTDEAGNYILAITMYAEYDDVYDISGDLSDFQSVDMEALYG